MRLRVFEISQGPKSAVAVDVEATAPLAAAYETMKSSLALADGLGSVTLHALRDRHVERAPLRTDFTLGELGLTDNSIIVVRRHRDKDVSSPRMSATKTVQPEALEAFLTPHRTPATRSNTRATPGTKTPVVAEASARPPTPPPRPITTSSPLIPVAPPASRPQDTEEHARRIAEDLQSAHAALRQSSAQQADLAREVSQMRKEQQCAKEQLNTLARATLARQSEELARLHQRYEESSAWLLKSPLSVTASTAPQCSTMTRQDQIRRLHHEILSHALRVFANTCTTATALHEAFSSADESLANVYDALYMTYPLPSFVADAQFTHFLRSQVPFLVKAAPLIQFLYQGHLAEFADHSFCTLLGTVARPDAWLHCVDTGAWHSCLCGLSQTAPPTWLLGESHHQIPTIQLATCALPFRCDRLGLANEQSPVQLPSRTSCSTALAILFAAGSAASLGVTARSSAELKASLVTHVRENLSYLHALRGCDECGL